MAILARLLGSHIKISHRQAIDHRVIIKKNRSVAKLNLA